MAVGVLPICRQTPLLSTPAPETTYCPVLTFRGDRRDVIVMFRLEERNEEIASLLLPLKSIVTFRRVGCETRSCVHAARALFVELSHPALQRAMRGQEAYESVRKLEFGIIQKGNSRSGQQLLSANVVLSFPNLIEEKALSVSYSIFTEQWEVQFSLGGQRSSLHHLQSRIPEHERSWGG